MIKRADHSDEGHCGFVIEIAQAFDFLIRKAAHAAEEARVDVVFGQAVEEVADALVGQGSRELLEQLGAVFRLRLEEVVELALREEDDALELGPLEAHDLLDGRRDGLRLRGDLDGAVPRQPLEVHLALIAGDLLLVVNLDLETRHRCECRGLFGHDPGRQVVARLVDQDAGAVHGFAHRAAMRFMDHQECVFRHADFVAGHRDDAHRIGTAVARNLLGGDDSDEQVEREPERPADGLGRDVRIVQRIFQPLDRDDVGGLVGRMKIDRLGRTDHAARSIGPEHVGLACDVTDHAACQKAVDQVLATFGQIDVLINKGVIKFTDLPPAAGAKYLERLSTRERMHAVKSIIVDEGDII